MLKNWLKQNVKVKNVPELTPGISKAELVQPLLNVVWFPN